jgi:hypothetical protein
MSEGDSATGDGDVDVEHEDKLFVDEAGAQRAINAALEDIWSGRHHDDDDAEEQDDDEEGEGEGEDEGGWYVEGEDVDVDWDDDIGNGNPNELSALDMLGEDFERNSVANGEQTCDILVCISTYNVMQPES